MARLKSCPDTKQSFSAVRKVVALDKTISHAGSLKPLRTSFIRIREFGGWKNRTPAAEAVRFVERGFPIRQKQLIAPIADCWSIQAWFGIPIAANLADQIRPTHRTKQVIYPLC